jgi:hypothetical protein
MAVPSEAFRAGDVYIDFPQEQVMFRYDKASAEVFRRFNGEAEEEPVAYDLDLFAQARVYGAVTTREHYLRGGNGA